MIHTTLGLTYFDWSLYVASNNQKLICKCNKIVQIKDLNALVLTL